MTAITLETLQSKQTELANLIHKFTLQSNAKTINHPAIEITLKPGERYAGPVLNADGQMLHHLVLMAERPTGEFDWNSAKDWAESVGGSLPTRQEQALLFANCKPHLEPSWHWSSEENEDSASCAWHCLFGSGHQGSDSKSFEGSAVAVRRLFI